MKRKWLFVVAPLGFLLFIVVGGVVVRLLWNWLLPPLFGWRELGFWQALGMLALCRILFGGLGMRGAGPSRSRRRMHERWAHMTPDERERLRQGLRGAGGPEPSTSEDQGQ